MSERDQLHRRAMMWRAIQNYGAYEQRCINLTETEIIFEFGYYFPNKIEK